MKKIKNIAKKLCCIGIAASYMFAVTPASADTVSDLEERQGRLENELSEVEAALAEYEDMAEESEEYLKEYNEKMKLQEKRVELSKQHTELLKEDIAALETDIKNGEAEVEESMEKFGQRLRAIYMSGGDSVAEVLAGSSDFYDMLSRIEFTERISRHDSKMIDALKEQVEKLEADKTEYAEKLAAIEEQKSEEEKYYSELRETYEGHAETKKFREAMIEDYRNRTEEIEAERYRIEVDLQEEIRRLQRENEAKKKAEEEARIAEQERLRKIAEENGEEYVPEEKAAAPAYSETGFIWPVPTVRNIIDGFGNRWFEEEQRYENHKGIDINKPGCGGEAVIASAGGTVLQAGDRGDGYGECVIIDHGDGLITRYAHNKSVAVSVGDEVTQGQVISYIGHTGWATGDHCHFEVRMNGEPVDPMNYVSTDN